MLSEHTQELIFFGRQLHLVVVDLYDTTYEVD